MTEEFVKTQYQEYKITKKDLLKSLWELKKTRASFSSVKEFEETYLLKKKEVKETLRKIKANNKKHKEEVRAFHKYRHKKDNKTIKELKQSYHNDCRELLKEIKEANKEKAKGQILFPYLKRKRELYRQYLYQKNLVRPNKIYQVFTLIKLNLSDKINLRLLRNGGIRFIVFYVAALAIFSYVSYLCFSIFKGFTGLDISPNKPFIHLFIYFVLIISVISASFSLTTNLYEDVHNRILLPLPVTRSQIYFSKLFSSLILELRKSGIVYFAILMGYGMTFKLVTFVYFIKVVSLCLIFPFFIILFGQFLSIVLFLVKVGLKRIPFVNILLAIGFVTLAVVIINHGTGLLVRKGEASLYNLLIGLHNLFNNGFNRVTKFSYFSRQIINYLFAYKIKAFIALIKVIAYLTVLALVSYVNSFFYYKIYDLNNQKGTTVKGKRFINTWRVSRLPIFFSYVVKEAKEMQRDPRLFNMTMAYSVLMPLLFYFLNRLFKTLTLSPYGHGIVFFAQIFLGLLLLTTANIMASTVITRDGGASYLLKTSPRDVRYLVLAKLGIIFTLSFVIIVFSLFLNFRIGLFSLAETILMHLLFLVGTFIHIIWSAEFDIKDPLDDEYQETGVLDENKNVTRSIGLGIIFSIIVSAFVILFYKQLNVTGLMIAIGILMVFLVYRIVLAFFKINVYIRWQS